LGHTTIASAATIIHDGVEAISAGNEASMFLLNNKTIAVCGKNNVRILKLTF
jgi:hypothetical protein